MKQRDLKSTRATILTFGIRRTRAEPSASADELIEPIRMMKGVVKVEANLNSSFPEVRVWIEFDSPKEARKTQRLIAQNIGNTPGYSLTEVTTVLTDFYGQ